MDLRTFAFLVLALAAGCPRSSDAPDAPTGGDAPTTDAPLADAPPVDAPGLLDTPAADAPSVDTPAPTDTPAMPASCDARVVTCDRIPPMCGVGEAPSVMGTCWGPCIPATMCTCSTAEECPAIRGYSETCHTGRGFCGPFL